VVWNAVMILNSLYRRTSFYINVYIVQVQTKGDRVPNNQPVWFIQQCGSVYYCCAMQTSQQPDPASIPVVIEFLAQSGEESPYIWVRLHASVYPHAYSRRTLNDFFWNMVLRCRPYNINVSSEFNLHSYLSIGNTASHGTQNELYSCSQNCSLQNTSMKNKT
jgi:hypothetical protein